MYVQQGTRQTNHSRRLICALNCKFASLDPNMKNKKLDAVEVWKQLEDLAVPRLHLSLIERAMYSHLLRHSRLEGRVQLRVSIPWLARGACRSCFTSRQSARARGAHS